MSSIYLDLVVTDADPSPRVELRDGSPILTFVDAVNHVSLGAVRVHLGQLSDPEAYLRELIAKADAVVDELAVRSLETEGARP